MNAFIFAVGGFANNNYWSSTENDNNNAWKQNFNNGNQNNNNKNNTNYVRAVRDFKQTILSENLSAFSNWRTLTVFFSFNFINFLLFCNSHYSTYHQKKNQKLNSKNYLMLNN